MPALLLTPAGHLLWRTDEYADAHDAHIGRAFERDWREGLFLLAARPPPAAPTPSLRYWKSIGERYLIALCHLPPDAAKPQVAPPSQAELGDWMLAAPPLQGGEYLSTARLRGVWDALDAWTQEALRADGGLERFIARRAPKWRQIGRSRSWLRTPADSVRADVCVTCR